VEGERELLIQRHTFMYNDWGGDSKEEKSWNEVIYCVKDSYKKVQKQEKIVEETLLGKFREKPRKLQLVWVQDVDLVKNCSWF